MEEVINVSCNKRPKYFPKEYRDWNREFDELEEGSTPKFSLERALKITYKVGITANNYKIFCKYLYSLETSAFSYLSYVLIP